MLLLLAVKRCLLALLIVALLFFAIPAPSVSAFPGILGTWSSTYSSSSSDEAAGCRLCHANPSGGNPWNAYGWSVRQEVVGNGQSVVNALAAIESMDADGNGISNIDEINANVQPGWTTGSVNTHFDKNGTTVTDQSPPANIGALDPQAPKLENPIVETINMTNSYQISLTVLADGFVAPLWGTATPSVTGQLFVLDQVGLVWRVDLASGDKFEFLNASGELVELGAFGNFDERGLLGFAFHPNYGSNGLVYTYSSEPISGTADFSTMPVGTDANHQSVIAEWQVMDPSNVTSTVDPASKRVLLRIDQPQFNHDGGHIAFGPDNMLYIALGDGGGADDVGNVGHGTDGNGQDATNPLGAILRIDPTGNNAGNGQYGIPADNPFTAGGDNRLDEIFAYGFRNPFHFSFDAQTGDLYAGDVGQNDIEEVDVVVSGGNYGWHIKEGTFFFDPNGSDPGFVTETFSGTVPPGLIDPIAQYDHDDGLSVIGGFVYRGTDIPLLNGIYIFGDWSLDFNSPPGRLFYLNETGQIKEFVLKGMNALDIFLNGFGEDNRNELYVMGNKTGTPFPDENNNNTGVVYKITSDSTITTPLPVPATDILYFPLATHKGAGN